MATIRHSGEIQRIAGGTISVVILQAAACSMCRIKGHCSASEAKEKVITVPLKGNEGFSVGDKVTVTMTQGNATYAVAVGFLVPFVVMVLTLFLVYLFTKSEAWAALCSLAALVPYYVAAHLMRGRLFRRITFGIEMRQNVSEDIGEAKVKDQ